MTVDFIYLFRQIEFTHQHGHALVLSPFAGLLNAQEELETSGVGSLDSSSNLISIRSLGAARAGGCRARLRVRGYCLPK